MDGGERADCGQREPGEAVLVARPMGADELLEGGARDVLAHDVGLVLADVDIEQPGCGKRGDPARGVDLAGEAGAGDLVAEVVEHLDGHLRAVGSGGEVDRALAAAAQGAQHPVVADPLGLARTARGA
ncbi:hypothetical protein GCM10020219_072090 [Nonomuraea dietziae]